MASCAECGYELQPFEAECPKCKRLAEQAQARGPAQEVHQSVNQPSEQLATQPGDPVGVGETGAREQVRQPSQTALVGSGAVVGAVYGAIVLATYILVDRWFFGGSESAKLGMIGALFGAAIVGAVLGAIIGVATVTARSSGAGTATGAIVFGLLKGLGISFSGLGGGFAALGLVVGLVYGALIGWAVSTSVIRSIKWP